jgi:hypothetical protein
MKQTTSTTSYIAIIVTIGVLAYFFLSAWGIFKSSESNQTQINQIVYGGWILVLGYYFGASKKREPGADANVSADTMKVNAENVNVQEK